PGEDRTVALRAQPPTASAPRSARAPSVFMVQWDIEILQSRPLSRVPRRGQDSDRGRLRPTLPRVPIRMVASVPGAGMNEQIEAEGALIADRLRGRGFTCERIADGTWRSHFRGRHASLPFFVRASDDGFLTFAFVPFLRS